MFRNGIYKIGYSNALEEDGPLEHALAVLRDGRLIGSDRHGAVFVGEPIYGPGPLETIKIELTLPPGAELVTGYTAGPQGTVLRMRGQFDPALNVQTTRIDVMGEPVDLSVTYLGPLPE